MRSLIALTIAILISAPAVANDDDVGGTLNPEELSIGRVMTDAREGKVDMITCAHGYHVTKAGRHRMAREIFEACVAAGYTGAMTWMSQMEDNGLGGPEDPVAAAAWDKRAADLGDPIGQFNYGLDLLRGRGVTYNPALGREYVDKAAAQGLDSAVILKDADYDLDVVTPDADNWKYDLHY